VRHLGQILLALALLFVCPLPVVALEILELTGGSISYTMSNALAGFAQVDITGPRIAIWAQENQFDHGYNFRCTILGGSNCSPGATLQVGGGGAGGDFLVGLATLDGVTHGLTWIDPHVDSLKLFLSASVLIPEFGSISSVVLTAPFVLTGELYRTGFYCPTPFVCSGDTALSTTYLLHGRGIFYGAMHRENRSPFGDFWQTDSARFDLQLTPEPATLLLWGTSAAGLTLARWYRRTHAHAA
jgi:hypothetical protein